MADAKSILDARNLVTEIRDGLVGLELAQRACDLEEWQRAALDNLVNRLQFDVTRLGAMLDLAARPVAVAAE